MTQSREEGGGETAVRGRILEAAFAAFMKNGYAATSTLEIATRARVSKRELYATVGNKQQMLIACISERARRLRLAADLPAPDNREALSRMLASFGTQLVREISDPRVVAVFRLAIAEAVQAPGWRGRSIPSGARRAVPPCAKSWSRPRRPDCSKAARPNWPSSSAGCSGAP
jgi:AcrR family transcriptional regulator